MKLINISKLSPKEYQLSVSEADILRNLNYPFIIKLYHTFYKRLKDGLYFIIREKKNENDY